jgi:hypothetical protein
MFTRSVFAASLCWLAVASAHASCHDRPGTPINVSARATSPTTIELGWVNRASEGYVPYGIFGIPYSGDLMLFGGAVYLSRGAIYFDVSVREDSPAGPAVGQDRTGFGPFETLPPPYMDVKLTQFSNLRPATNYCFSMRARTEAGTQGCVSQRASEWTCASTPSFPVVPKPKAIIPIPDVDPGVLKRPTRAATAAIRPTACKIGYVWRVARPSDLACVTPESRSRVAAENRSAFLRVQPGGGAYGPNTCQAGFVWREAFVGDLVCVTPQVRALVREENQLAATRVQRS